MREVISQIDTWRRSGKQVGIATNVRRNGMTLRPLGAKMAMTTNMEIAGSVTGGCIEGAVYEEAQKVINSHQSKLIHYGVSGEVKPWDIGLTCGTSLDVFIESMDSPVWNDLYPHALASLQQNRMVSITTVITGSQTGKKMMIWPNGRTLGDLGNQNLNEDVKSWALHQMTIGESNWAEFSVGEEKMDIFVDVLEPKSRLIVVGASHLAIPLVTLGKNMGYQTIVIDPREAFATRDRFPDVDELITEWPSTALENLHLDESCYVAVISHDDKLDNPALAVALTRSTRYVGVLGTRKRIPLRFSELRNLGVSEEQLKKLHAPIGLPLGAALPEEIAISILSEMVASKHGLFIQETVPSIPADVAA